MFSTASFEFAKALGLAFSAAYPILSGTALVGALLLMQPHPMAGKPPDAELVMLSVRMAGIALEQKSMAERLAHHSQHDTLTGLVNRFRLLQILDQQVANSGARAKTVAVLFIGLDRFKQINDTLGHGAAATPRLAWAGTNLPSFYRIPQARRRQSKRRAVFWRFFGRLIGSLAVSYS
jgi:predicted signal transduction protein with EAL and GGDEF domain